MNGNQLISAGWTKEGQLYKRGDDVIIYDGVHWYINSQRIFDDYSEYLKQPGMLDYIEKEWLEKPGEHEQHAKIVNEVVEKRKLHAAWEIGCGTGEVASRLNKNIHYIGVDSNEHCIKIANGKMSVTSIFTFLLGDIRVLDLKRVDLVFSFGFLKHFGLHEWSEIFKRIASFGRYFIFDMPIADTVKDDGVEYHHVWATVQMIFDECEKNGLQVVKSVEMNKDEVCFITKRV